MRRLAQAVRNRALPPHSKVVSKKPGTSSITSGNNKGTWGDLDYPDCYDADLAVGVENYLLSLKPLPLRWLLRLGGAGVDENAGIEDLRITAVKGRYLLPYARLLLALAALRDRDAVTARQMLTWLATEFPNNDLYWKELVKLR